MESVSNKKRKRSIEQKLNSERNDYYKKLRKEQKKKRKKRRNGSEKQPEAPAIKRNTERQKETQLPEAARNELKKVELAERSKTVTATNEARKDELAERPETASKEVKKNEAVNYWPRQLIVRKDESSRGKLILSAALKVNTETNKTRTETTKKRRLAQAPRSEKKFLSDTDVTELTNVKRVAGAKPLGSGTFGTCYPGTFRQYRVVIKEYKARTHMNGEHDSLERLRRAARHEARVIKQLGDHPGIPWLFGVCTTKMPVSIVMKFHNDGEESVTIYKAAKDKKVAEAKKWNGIFLETSEALEHIHNCGYAHNDLKSNNVVLEKREDQQLHPVIIDFGNSVLLKKAKSPVAKPVHQRKAYQNSYIAPELLDGTGKPSVESDIYALAFLIKGVYIILGNIGNIDANVKCALAKLPKSRPPISVLKVAFSVDN